MKVWDERKSEINRRRHKLGFETALLVFDDPFAVTAEDYIDDTPRCDQTFDIVAGLPIFVAYVYRVIDGEEKPKDYQRTKGGRI